MGDAPPHRRGRRGHRALLAADRLRGAPGAELLPTERRHPAAVRKAPAPGCRRASSPARCGECRAWRTFSISGSGAPAAITSSMPPLACGPPAASPAEPSTGCPRTRSGTTSASGWRSSASCRPSWRCAKSASVSAIVLSFGLMAFAVLRWSIAASISPRWYSATPRPRSVLGECGSIVSSLLKTCSAPA